MSNDEKKFSMNLLDRIALAINPAAGMRRVQARARAMMIVRHYEAASTGRRTSGWSKGNGDANAVSGRDLATLRAIARDLVRNNPWARRGLRVIQNNTVGWGILPKPAEAGDSKEVWKRWKKWGETTECDAAGRLTFYGMQRQVISTVAEAGEVLVRRRWRQDRDGLAVPFQLQLLEPDHLDSSYDIERGPQGGPIIHGVEFDALGRRVAYRLFDEHPGARRMVNPVSKRVSAYDVLHVFAQERIGQVRGVTWFAPVELRLKDFDEYEDATLMKQKISALMAAFVTDLEGGATNLGEASSTDPMLDTMEPGMIFNLPAGKQVTIANPPAVNDHESFSATQLRSVAAGLGITYEELTKDYSKVNYSSARMGRISSKPDIADWQWNLLIPLFCTPVWMWMLEALTLVGVDAGVDPPTWMPPALPMIDPDKEGAALSKMVRSGAMTHDAMIREQGYDPDEHFEEYKRGLERIDKLGLVLDSDPRNINGSGGKQAAPVAPGAPAGAPGGETPAEDAKEDPTDEQKPAEAETDT